MGHKKNNCLQIIAMILKSTVWQNISLIATFLEYEESINEIAILNKADLKKLKYYDCNLVTTPNFNECTVNLDKANTSDKSDNLFYLEIWLLNLVIKSKITLFNFVSFLPSVPHTWALIFRKHYCYATKVF